MTRIGNQVHLDLDEAVLASFAALKSDAPHAQWIVLRTRSRQERAVERDLLARDIGAFLPLCREVRFYGSRKVVVQLPMFAGYVFMHGTLDDAYAVDRHKRIVSILQVIDQDQLDRELRNIHMAVREGAVLEPHPYLTAGVEVEVRSGPFRGMQGVVESRTRPDRIVLQIEYLNRAMSMEIDVSLLDVID
jgi:transcriptional antiterminator RfaH